MQLRERQALTVREEHHDWADLARCHPSWAPPGEVVAHVVQERVPARLRFSARWVVE